jgi:outer membrane protein insertion porin family
MKYILIIVAIFLFSIPSEAQNPEGQTVAAIRVEGNLAIGEPTILSKIKTKPGRKFSQEVMDDDIKRLYALGYFTDVRIDVEHLAEGVSVTILVEEKPIIKEIIFEGNEKINTRRLKKIVKTKEKDMLNFSKLSEDVREIKSFYEKNGFHRSNVKYELEEDKELNRVTVRILVDEEMRMRIKRVFIEGNDSIDSNKIISIMETRPAWIFRRGYFDDEAFEKDLARIKMYYRDRGFLDVSIAPKFDYDRENAVMYITLKINEGGQYKIRNITVKGNIIFPAEEVREVISQKKGEPFSFTALQKDGESARSLYYGRGYMNAEIGVDTIPDPKRQTLDIVFNIDGKEVVYVGKIDIKGNTKTKDVVIRRELRTYPGERFDGDKIRRSKERLYNLGFFEDIYFETRPSHEPNVNDLEISVKETKTGEFAFGGGYSSIDEFIGFIQITQKNFDLLNFPYFTGDGQQLAVKAELGTVRTNYDVSWTEPWIFDYPLSFGFDTYYRTHFRRSQVGYGYKEVRGGGDVRFGKEFLEYFNSTLMYKLENVDISDIPEEATQDLRDEEGENLLSRLVLGVNFDNRDNIFSPTRGFSAGIRVENTGGFLAGDKNFFKTNFWTSFYYSPLEKIVVELRGRAGIANPYSDTDKIPIYERFYAGGASTIRGYRERKVGPRDLVSSTPVGGEAMLIGNIELTFPVYEKVIKGAVFYDVGNVWSDLGDFGQSGYKQGVGVGIRIKTPIGPLKLDWGYPLSDNHNDQQEGEFYFSVSHGF